MGFWSRSPQTTSELELATAVERSSAVIWFTPLGEVLDTNSIFCALMGYDRAEIVGRRHAIFVDPAYAASADYRTFWDLLRQGQHVTRTFERIGKGGRRLWIEASYVPVKNAEGQVTKVVKIATDVTSRIEAAADAHSRLEALDRSQATIEFTTEGTIVTANPNFLKAVGYTLDEIRGKHHSLFIDPATKGSPEYRSFWSDLARGIPRTGEFRRFGKGGREVWLQASYNPILNEIVSHAVV